MRQLNVVYMQRFNHRHGIMVGHLFQGQRKAILVQQDNLPAGPGYIALNPAEDADWLLGQFRRERKRAIESCRRYAMEGKGPPSPLDQTRHQHPLFFILMCNFLQIFPDVYATLRRVHLLLQ